MTLISKVQNICDRLAENYGWYRLFLQHGLDIKARPLEAELTKKLNINRTLKGFEDFCLAGERAIEARNPCCSLLYHALASPNVTTNSNDDPSALYPTAAEIETVLDYVYGISPSSIEEIRQHVGTAESLAIVVFAYEYRPAPDTVHRHHADLCFSRTGIARLGTQPARYDPKHRGFLPFFADDKHAMRVLPARYSAYIAVQKKGNPERFGPMNAQAGDRHSDFWVPVYRLYNGTECIRDFDLELNLECVHINEKLRRIHQSLGPDSGWAEPDISKEPFVISTNLTSWMDKDIYGFGLLSAVPQERLVEPATYQDQPLGFHVPENPSHNSSSMMLPREGLK